MSGELFAWRTQLGTGKILGSHCVLRLQCRRLCRGESPGKGQRDAYREECEDLAELALIPKWEPEEEGRNKRSLSASRVLGPC